MYHMPNIVLIALHLLSQFNKKKQYSEVYEYILQVSKITVDGDCSHEIKKSLLLGGRGMTHLDSILKTKDITLPTKDCIVKAVVFPVVMYGCES